MLFYTVQRDDGSTKVHFASPTPVEDWVGIVQAARDKIDPENEDGDREDNYEFDALCDQIAEDNPQLIPLARPDAGAYNVIVNEDCL